MKEKWINWIFVLITIAMISFVGYYSVFVIKNLNFLISSLHNKIDIYEQYRQEALEKLKENDNSQLKIDKLQQIDIKNLTKFLIELGILTKENDEKQMKLTKDIVEVIEGIQENQFKMRDELKLKKQISLDDIENIKKANIIVYNTTASVEGSGSHIIIEGKHYILTCAHLIKDEKDYIWGILDDGNWHPLGLIKINKKKDLALFEIFMVEDLPCLEISNEFPMEGSEVVVIGNPSDLTDIVTDGIIAKIKNKEYIFTNKIYFGNSGGAILYKGKIVGVVVQIGVCFKSLVVVNYGYGVKLDIIKEFLDIK